MYFIFLMTFITADKTVWTGSRHNLSLLGGCGPRLHIGDNVIKPSDQVLPLGVTIASDLDLDRHISNVCKTKLEVGCINIWTLNWSLISETRFTRQSSVNMYFVYFNGEETTR